MKVQRVQPYSAEKTVGETEHHYGVPFTVTESGTHKAVMVAELPDDEAQAMIDADRVTAVIEEPAEPKGKK